MLSIVIEIENTFFYRILTDAINMQPYKIKPFSYKKLELISLS